ncbi:MAG: hypothetical protein JSU63_02295 [Phycisphaerales bacterium]|nr:MAG: hypothetical protein JSU63_02295 [Phycisphaerales bacterium]
MMRKRVSSMARDASWSTVAVAVCAAAILYSGQTVFGADRVVLCEEFTSRF